MGEEGIGPSTNDVVVRHSLPKRHARAGAPDFPEASDQGCADIGGGGHRVPILSGGTEPPTEARTQRMRPKQDEFEYVSSQPKPSRHNRCDRSAPLDLSISWQHGNPPNCLHMQRHERLLLVSRGVRGARHCLA